jgi:hypothetical protein
LTDVPLIAKSPPKDSQTWNKMNQKLLSIKSILKQEDRLFFIDTTEFMVNRITGPAMELAIEQSKKERQKNFEEDLPEYLQDYQDVFEEQEFNELLQRRPWDHAIELLPGSKTTLNCKLYPLTLDKQKQLKNFLEEHLQTG